MIPLVAVVGPTATGKSKLALQLAVDLEGEIVSADSAQVYRYLDIGTAKPTLKERQTVKHHLIDVIHPHEEFSVAEYKKLADEAIDDIYEKGKLPILCGGTGLYINAVTERFAFSSSGKNPQLRQQLDETAREKGLDHLYSLLKEVDPDSAQKIHPHDKKRIIRALEVYYTEGVLLSRQQKETLNRPSRFHLLLMGLNKPREELYRAIERRTDSMMEKGFVEEVKWLLENYPAHAPGLNVLGYRQIRDYLQNLISYHEAVESIKKETRNYAKRQLTWFRRDERVRWFNPHETDLSSLEKFINDFLQEKDTSRRIT